MKSLASFWSPSTDQSDTISISEASTTTHYTAVTQQTSTFNRSNVQHTTWRCSQLQKQWTVNHPVFKSIQKNKTITNYLSEQKLNKPDYYCLLDDISLLRPLSNPAIYNDEPQLADYVQLLCRLWVPEYF